MNKFLIKILTFSITFLFIIITIILLFKIITDRSTSYNNLLQDEFSVLILGDSQTEADLNDTIINNSINLSNSGDHIYFFYVKLKKLLNTGYSPKNLILGFSPHNLYSKDFYEESRMKTKIKKYFFMMDLNDFQDIVNHNFTGGYQGLISTIFYSPRRNNFWSSSEITNVGIGGYRKLTIGNNELLNRDVADSKTYEATEPDKISLKYFNKIIELCEQYKIRLIILNTPIHKSLQIKQLQQKGGYNNFIKNLDENIIIWDFFNFELDDRYFYDENHLNEDGASIFSAFINAKLIKTKKN